MKTYKMNVSALCGDVVCAKSSRQEAWRLSAVGDLETKRKTHPDFIFARAEKSFDPGDLVVFNGDRCEAYMGQTSEDIRPGAILRPAPTQHIDCKCPFINLGLVHKASCSLHEAWGVWR